MIYIHTFLFHMGVSFKNLYEILYFCLLLFHVLRFSIQFYSFFKWMWQTRTTFISTYIPTPCLYIQYRKMIKRQTQTALEKRFILLIKFSYRKGDCRMLILTKDIVMIVIKIIINIQNKRKMAKVKTLFFK